MDLKKLNYLRKRLSGVMLLIGLLIIIFMISKVQPVYIFSIIKGFSIPFITVAILFWIVNIFVYVKRFQNLSRVDIEFWDLLKIHFQSYLLNYAGFIQGIGYGAKIGFLKLQKKSSITDSSSAVSSELIFDMIFSSLITLTLFIMFWDRIINRVNDAFNFSPLIFIVFIAMPIIGFSVLIFLYKNHKEKLKRFISGILNNFSRSKISQNILMSVIYWLIAPLFTYFLFVANRTPIDYYIILMGSAAGFLFGLFSMIPGGLGVRDAIWVFVFSLSGVSVGIVITITIMSRVLGIITVFIMLLLMHLYNHLNKNKRSIDNISIDIKEA